MLVVVSVICFIFTVPCACPPCASFLGLRPRAARGTGGQLFLHHSNSNRKAAAHLDVVADKRVASMFVKLDVAQDFRSDMTVYSLATRLFRPLFEGQKQCPRDSLTPRGRRNGQPEEVQSLPLDSVTHRAEQLAIPLGKKRPRPVLQLGENLFFRLKQRGRRRDIAGELQKRRMREPKERPGIGQGRGA